MSSSCAIGPVSVGGASPLVVIAGPCLLESYEVAHNIGCIVRDACLDLGLSYIFKASFDKANRSSPTSARGPGLAAGLDMLAKLRDELGVPVTTDIHEPAQAHAIAQAIDLIQIPAFLCRQTDLIVASAEAAGAHNRALNIKKGQFLSPGEMAGPLRKALDAGAHNLMLTERGTTFGYHRLINDFIGVGDLLELTIERPDAAATGPFPVCFDCTHSTQRPGVADTTGGFPRRAPLLAQAAVAAGVHAVFIECHPDPSSAASDAATMLPLATLPPLLHTLARLHAALHASPASTPIH